MCTAFILERYGRTVVLTGVRRRRWALASFRIVLRELRATSLGALSPHPPRPLYGLTIRRPGASANENRSTAVDRPAVQPVRVVGFSPHGRSSVRSFGRFQAT